MADFFYPFKRMNYFSGQLLTAQNFIDEQRYINEKRWLMNHLIYGGKKVVLKGLCVNNLGENKIQVTPGVALDGMGREVVLSQPEEITVESGHKYVCLEYREIPVEPVPQADSCTSPEKCNHNRIQEDSKPYLDFTYPQDEHIIVLSSINRDENGVISIIECTPSQQVYSNALLFETITKMEEKINKLQRELDQIRSKSS